MFSLFSKQKSAIGLDISDATLRLMQLDRLGTGFFPVAFSEVTLAKGLVVDEKIGNPEKLAEVIRVSRLKPAFGQFTSSYVALSVPESKSFVRVITVPKMTEKEAREAVPLEAEQYIPIASDQVYMDYRTVLGEEKRGSDKMKVVISATPKNVVDDYVQVAKLAGLRPIAIEVESEAVARCLISKKREQEPTLILDVSSLHTHLIIYDQGTLQFTSSLPVAGNSFTTQIAQQLTVSPEEAEKLKIQMGLIATKGGGKVRAAVAPLLASLIEAIRNTVNFYREHSDGARQISRVLLCGGGAKLRGLNEYLNQALNGVGQPQLLVEVGDPWVNVLEQPIKKIPPISKADSISYATALGLALRGVQNE